MNNSRNLPIPITWLGRLIYAWVTIVLPVICFALTFNGKADWQSGQLSDYAEIMLGGTVSQLFYPFLLYAMICMLLLLVFPHQFSQFFVVRLGIYTGTVLSLQYAIILGVSLFVHKPWFSDGILYIIVLGVLTCAIPFGISRLFLWSKRKFGTRRTWIVSVGLIVCLWVILLPLMRSHFTSWSWKGMWSWEIIYVPFYILALLSLASAPFWCLTIALSTSRHLLKCERLEKRRWIFPGVMISVWLVAYIGVWRMAILRTIEIYNTLPTTPPDCYIATAAARGHRKFVKSRPVVAGDGNLIWINSQMQYLKSIELVLMVIFPVFHRFLRRIYNRVGPLLVHTLIHPLLADLVYVLLKPIEWGAKGLMRIFVPASYTIVNQIYCGKSVSS